MNRSTLGFPSFTNCRSLPKPMSIELVMPSSHLILCWPLLLLPPIPPSIRVFFNESIPRMRWPKYWSFSFNISPSNEHSGPISFRIDWLDLLADQGTLKSLLQHHSSKASILQRSAFFIIQLSHPYMTTGKTFKMSFIWIVLSVNMHKEGTQLKGLYVGKRLLLFLTSSIKIKKTKIMASGPITWWEIDGETVENSVRFHFWVLQNHCRWWLQPWN